MAGLSNKDSSFFEIVSPDVDIETTAPTADFISLTVNESMGQMATGSLVFNDPFHIYARVLRIGVRLRLAWGYKNIDANARSLLGPIQNLDEFTGSIERRGLEVLVMAPGGAGTADSRSMYTCNFMALGMRGDDQIRWFRSGTYGDVINTVLDELGVSRLRRDVRFSLATTPITEETAVMQTETNFAFLTRLASREWRTFFALNYDPSGNLWAMFVDPQYLGRSPYQNAVMGAFGGSNRLEWNGLSNNVISYTWKNNAGRSGTGDSVQILIVDGVPTFVRYNAATQEVVTWELRPELIESALRQKQNEMGLVGVTALTRDFLGARNFEEIKHFFKDITHKTAPQGYGYEVILQMFGNPMLTAGNLAEFGLGFPEVLGSTQTNWYFRQVSHSITRAGYLMTSNVADALSFSPTGTVL